VARRLLPDLIAPSTRAFMREARRLPDFPLFQRLHGYVYACWPYLYIGIGTGEHPLAHIIHPLAGLLAPLFPPRQAAQDEDSVRITFPDTYHGKVVTLEAATQLVTVEREVELRDLEQIIPYHLARDLVLKNPDHIVALECPCRASRANPCLPLDVCLIVGEPFASFVLEHHPRRARWISQDEAVEILRAEHQRGHVSHAFFKEAMLNRFYAICNCCACCCGAMQIQREGQPMLSASGYVSQVKAELCGGCGTCVKYCQFGAISLVDGKSRVDQAACMGCGVCVSHCPRQALSLVRDESKGVPLEMRVLLEGAAVPAGGDQ
jgi:ferredoxin